uniref:Peptidase A1 domain-containing protein n=1 Tax=Oryza punctata TaxID=4537 RepID=A0A0E0JTE7_ORYPU
MLSCRLPSLATVILPCWWLSLRAIPDRRLSITPSAVAPASSHTGRVSVQKLQTKKERDSKCEHLKSIWRAKQLSSCEAMTMSGVGEMIASSVANRVTSRLGDLVVEEATLLWRFKDDLDDMEEKMRDLEAVMQDADDKARQGGKDGAAERRWLTKLKSVAYDIEDMLDELNASQLIKNHQPKLKVFFSRNNQLLQWMTIAHNMKSLRGKIDKIEKEGQMLNLVHHEARAKRSKHAETFAAINNEETDIMDIGMVGRDAEKEKIINLLLNTEAKEHISIIPIVGLGGLGKTMLAQAIYVDKRIDIFDVRVWVYVSKDFDLLRIGQSIVKRVNQSINLDKSDLQFVQDKLKEELANRRYLIVLDDLWEEYGETLENLKKMLQHGSKGSKIILTTRNISVVQILCTGYFANKRKICPVHEPDYINLGVLSLDDCWRVMKRRIFGPDDDQSGLEEIGREIAERCGGLPLVANALGQVMSEHRNIEAWKDIREKKIILDFKADHQQDTLECLMLSYYYMKLEFKRCFTYLAAFSKGFVMDSDRLIQQWSALGYIQSRHNGQRCINYLLGMSFLHISQSSLVSPVRTKAPRKLTMHDLVHDLATIIAADEFLVMDATDPGTWNKANSKRYCRRVQLVNYKKQYKVFKDLPSKNMQTLILSNCSLETLPANIGNLHKLFYLDLSGNSDLTELPASSKNLLNLSLLNLSGCTKLEELPESIHNLKCLQQLDMSGCCALQKLPDKFGSLRKLSFVNLSGCSMLTKLPDNLNLESLEHINLSDCYKLKKLPEDFGCLDRLEVLDMSDCYNVQVLPQTFCQLKHLINLNLSDCHGLIQLPESFGDLSELQSLNLTSCSKLQSLPWSLCNMFNLKHLNLSYCIRLENLPSSFGDLHLQVLDLTGCYNLEDLPDSISNMTSLTLLNCATGSEYVFDKIQTIKKRLNLPGTVEHDVREIENGDFNSIVELGRLHCRELEVRHLENVERLEDARKANLRDMVELRWLKFSWELGGTRSVDNDKLVLENLIPPRTLEEFLLDGYMCMDFPYWVTGISSYLPYLMFIRICNLATCDSLPAFGQLPNLRLFSMINMPSIRKIGKEFYGEERNCKKLRVIWLERMANLEEWWTTRSGKEDEEFLIPNLHLLCVMNCPKLSFLPYPPRSMNWHLDGSDEVLPERGFGSLVSSTRPFCANIKNCNFSPDRWRRLQHLPTLEMFRVDGCSGLQTLPDTNCFSSLRYLSLKSWEDLETLPEWLGQLVSLESITIINCPKLTSLPKSLQNLTALRQLWLEGYEELEILPEWMGQLLTEPYRFKTTVVGGVRELEILPEGLGYLISLKKLVIKDCPKLTFLPESMKNLTALIELQLMGCSGLEISPELFGHLASLKCIEIQGCPNLTYLPESTKNLTALEELWLGGFSSLPEWIGQFICLKEINIFDSPNMTSLPESIQNLTSLRELYIWNCPRLIERCQGEDASNISHIPRIILDGEIFIPGQASQGSKVQASSPKIQALVAPITKDTKTGLHTLSISNKNYLLDLSGQLLWSPCSPSHPTVPCSSGECAAASGAHKYCNHGGRTCTVRPANPVTGERAAGDLTLTDIVANATDGKTPTSEVTVRGVISSCAPGSLLRSLPAMTAGDAGLGRGGVSLPTQLYSKLPLKRQFAVCLPSTAAVPGVAFFGGGPYNLMPPTLFDASTVLSYTDLVRTPTNPSAYSIKLRGIAMNQEAVHLPPGALSRGDGVTLDMAAPYTVLRRDVYRPFVAAFAKATARIPRMPSVAPFELCFNSSALGFTRVGYAVAPIDLMTSGGRNWTVFGSNSLAQVAGDTACLAFVDGGSAARSAVTVGAFQMENNFLLFDEAASRLGFSGTLFFIRTTCGNFNFARN